MLASMAKAFGGLGGAPLPYDIVLQVSVLYFSKRKFFTSFIVVVVQLPSHVQLFATPLIAAHQASLSLIIFWSLPKFMFIALVTPSSHLIL